MSPWSVNWTDNNGDHHTDPLDINCHCFDPTKTAGVEPGGVYERPQRAVRAQMKPRFAPSGACATLSENANFSRTFRIKERYTLQIRAEFTNIFNRVQYPFPLCRDLGD